jgi:predicted DNA binding CopG/RHH family protein
MKKKIPSFKSDHAAAAFVDKADLTQYDLSGATLTRFEIKPKDKSINLRLSRELYDAVRTRAALGGVPYQRFIRLTLEQAIAPNKTPSVTKATPHQPRDPSPQ